MAIIYESNGINIESSVTPKGVSYLNYGLPTNPTIVYLHGIGEVGKNPSALLSQSPISRGWNFTLGKPEGFKFPEFFNKGISVIAPVLKSGFWDPAYIDSFLSEINYNLMSLMGWSWGGGGTANYLNQLIKQHQFKCGVIMCMGNYSQAGVNVNCPVKLIHATNDSKTPVSNSDKFYAGVPEQYKSGYDKPTSGGHDVWSKLLEPSTGIYEWIKSFSTITPPIVYTQVVVELGSDDNIYFNLNGNRRKIA